jgi:hypothetical protein
MAATSCCRQVRPGAGEGTTAGTDNALWYDIRREGSQGAAQIPDLLDACAEGTAGAGLDAQPAGVRRRDLVEARALHDARGDYGSIFYNPFRQKWVQSIKQDGPRGRCRYYVESDTFLDGANWDAAVYWTNADRLDRPEPAGGYAGLRKRAIRRSSTAWRRWPTRAS